MLFKQLKNMINEADEEAAETPAAGSAEAPPKTDQTVVAQPEKKEIIKPLKVKQQIKDNSDGVGNEAYVVTNKIAKILETDLTEYYNITKIGASNNKITITADIEKMKGGLITSKITNDAVPFDKILSTIQQIIVAALGNLINAVKLNGPVEVAPGVFIITVLLKDEPK